MSTKRKVSKPRRRTLFNEKVNYQILTQMLGKGATLKFISLKEKFDPKEFRNTCGEETAPLFGIDSNNQAHCFSVEDSLQVNGGWKILYLGY